MQLSQWAVDVAVVSVCAGFAAIALHGLYYGIYNLGRRWKELTTRAALQAERERISGYLYTMDRWLCFDFPIVEDLRDWLNAYVHNSRVEAIGPDQLRERLRKKYGARTTS